MTIGPSCKALRPHVRRAVEELDQAVPGCSWGTYRGHDPDESLAADAMIPSWWLAIGIVVGNRLAAIVANAAWMLAHGFWYVIWRGRIWSMTRPKAGWLPYFDRNSANPSRAHKNHVHLSAYATPPKVVPPNLPAYSEGWTPPTPWVFYLDRQELGVTGSTSAWLIAKALGLEVRDGAYTAALRAAVAVWQRDTLGDDPANCDGILGPKQAAALFGKRVRIEAKS